ncbi:13290_t:CDS:2 [Entrophospora sp. SA101]|nr:13290_t:CDS:2 [Entrophospora sp. SA101]
MYIINQIGPIFNKIMAYIYLFCRISVHSKPSKERRGGCDDGTKTSIFTEITGPWKQNCKIKPYWDIYREGIHAKDAIDSDIRKNKSLKPDETKKSSFLLMSVQNLEDVMRIHQLLMSTKENAISYLEDSYTTPPHQVYSEWLCPTAGTPFKNPNLRITQEVAQI